jgi:hypothetical protein
LRRCSLPFQCFRTEVQACSRSQPRRPNYLSLLRPEVLRMRMAPACTHVSLSTRALSSCLCFSSSLGAPPSSSCSSSPWRAHLSFCSTDVLIELITYMIGEARAQLSETQPSLPSDVCFPHMEHHSKGLASKCGMGVSTLNYFYDLETKCSMKRHAWEAMSSGQATKKNWL